MLGSDPVDAQRLSFIGNVCAHNGDRNPDINFPPGSCVEVTNNVLYNAESQFAEVWESFGGTPVSIIGNTFVRGPNSSGSTQGIARNRIGSKGKAKIYIWDNNFIGNFNHISSSAKQALVSQTPCPPTVQAKSASQAYNSVLSLAGAWPRDAIDRRIVSDVKAQTGRIVSRPGKIPEIAKGKAYSDIDRDGMDDNWEVTHGSNPQVFDAWGDANGNGVSNFEDFLTYREGVVRAGQG